MEYPAIFWVAFLVCIFLAWFFSHRAKHKENMSKIEKGLELNEDSKNKTIDNFDWLKLGILLLGLGIGLLIIAILSLNNLLAKGGNALPLAILGICGGLSLIIAYYLRNNKSKM